MSFFGQESHRQPTHVAPAQPAPQAQRPARQRADSMSSKLGETAAVVFALGMAGALWWVGAYLTLYALQTVGIPVDRLGAWRWAVPVGISVVELLWWPRQKLAEFKLISFAGIAGIDMMSTLYGVHEWAKGRFLPLGTGYRVPTEGAGLIVPAIVVSIILTFVPERLARWAINELRTIWNM